MKISVKRAYEPAKRGDGERILVDRLWPRGVRKSAAAIDVWAKDIAPSGALRTWFHADPEKRYRAFAGKYRKELAGQRAAGRELLKGKKAVTLITAAKDVEHSHIPTLLAFLKRL